MELTELLLSVLIGFAMILGARAFGGFAANRFAPTPQALLQPFKVHPTSAMLPATTTRPSNIPAACSDSAVAIETLRAAVANAMASTSDAPPTTTGHTFVQALWAWADVRVPSLNENGETVSGKTRRKLRLMAGESREPSGPTDADTDPDADADADAKAKADAKADADTDTDTDTDAQPPTHQTHQPPGLDLLAAIEAAARDLPEAWQLKALEKTARPEGVTCHSVSYTARECRCLVANALLGNLRDTAAALKPEYKQGKGFNFEMSIFLDPTGIGRRESVWDDVVICREKLACFLEYMFVMSTVVPDADLDERSVTFELLERPLDAFESRLQLGQLGEASGAAFCAAETVVLHQNRMEEPMAAENADMAIPGLAAQRSYDSPLQGEGSTTRRKSAAVAAQRWAFTNFANMVYGYGEMIPSCTQEEVLQVCCPEFNVGMLHFGTMTDDQVVVVRNVRRTCDYDGYMGTFQFKPLAPDPLAPSAHDGAPPRVGDIITIDAVRSMHYDTGKLKN